MEELAERFCREARQRSGLRYSPQAHPAQVVTEGMRVLGIARRSRFPSSKQDTTTYAYTPGGACIFSH